jgi:SAM-dependent methyltransferase
VLGDFGGRLRWAEADLTQPSWSVQLGESAFDAVLSTTALHWLAIGPLYRLYSDVARLIRDNGVVLNGDHLAYGAHQPTMRAIAEWDSARSGGEHTVTSGQEDWDTWWAALGREPAIASLIAERERRLALRAQDHDRAWTLDVHESAMRNAGFREVATVWQRFDSRVLVGVR